MIEIRSKVAYRAFGLTIESQILLPELQPLMNPAVAIDVEIEIAELLPLWLETVKPNEKAVARENLFLFEVPGTALFCIQDGRKILISPLYEAEDAKIRLYILGTCMGVLLMQKRILPLHGSAIAIDGRAYAIVGDSGAGKSTLASEFLSRGYSLMSDDVIAVTQTEGQPPMVMPAYPQQKLWQESLTQFGMEASRFKSIFDRETKYIVPVRTFTGEPLPLAGVFELSMTESKEIQIETIQGLERLQTLFCHTFRQYLLSRLKLMEWHFGATARLSNVIELYRLRRPAADFTAPRLADLILEHIQ